MELPTKVVEALVELLSANASFYRIHAVSTRDQNRGNTNKKLSKKLQNLLDKEKELCTTN